ncbi:hypothetical protein Hdeb2414_s0008g00288461 [Helianthus debilis subsp. tardiflorus]
MTREIVGLDTPFARLFHTTMEDSYREITVEFLSSFIYAPHPDDYVEDPDHVVHKITFHLASQEFGMSLRDFVVHSALHTQAKLDTNIYTQGVRAIDRQALISFGMVVARVPFLYYLLRPQPCALVACLAEYFATAYHRQQRGRLHGGSYVTAIARSIGIVPESDPLLSPTILSTTLGRASVSSMRLTHMFDGIGLRFWTRDYQVWQPEVLPEVI